jgi:hypothetical protein
MSSPLPAMPDMKADGAERAPLRLAPADAVPAATRGGVIALERPAARGVLDDIVAARMKDLADRLAAGKALLEAADIDAPLGPADVEIQPVSLAAITRLRGLAIADTDDDDWLPAAPPTPIAPSARSEPTDAATAIIPAPPPPAEPTMSKKSSETASERNLASLLAVLEQPPPLRLVGELPTGVLVPVGSPAIAPTPVPPADAAEDARETVVTNTDTGAPSEIAHAPEDSALLRRAGPAFATDAPLLLADKSGNEIRFVDLANRQQSLLDQLNNYPTAPPAPEQQIEPPPARPPSASAPPSARSVVDDLAPTLPVVASDKRRRPSAEGPPPFPPAGVMRLTCNTPDDDEHLLPERAPMIIERARAERSGLHRASKSTAASSPLPAFAAGVAVALAIAGSLLFVL